jgi:5'(3')-deoxyribonucleotidase
MMIDNLTKSIAEAYKAMNTQSKYGIIYCDMDGVVADFMKGSHDVLGRHFDQKDPALDVDTSKRKTREKLAKTRNFWENLPVMPGAQQLWKFINRYDAQILTAYPDWDPSAKRGKRIWITKHFGQIPNSRFHAVKRHEKQDYAMSDNGKPNILIDDYAKNIREFEAAGGIGVHHTDAETTISKLKKLGF